jgi:hypothetical protein
LQKFYDLVEKTLREQMTFSGYISKEKLRKSFFTHENEEEMRKSRILNMENNLDDIIRNRLKSIQETVLSLQQEAIKENTSIDELSLENIDYIKRKCHMKLDRKNKKLELKFKHSNKIQEYLLLSRFLHLFFDKQLKESRKDLMKFKESQKSVKKRPIDKSKNLDSKYFTSMDCISIYSKKNVIWKNENGHLNQMMMLSHPIESGLIELHVSNLNFNCTNLEILIMNRVSYDYWKKKVKFSSNENFDDVPCIAKIDFDLRKSHELVDYCKQEKETESMEMSINGCKRQIKSKSIIVHFEKKNQQVHIWNLNNNLLCSLNLKKENKGIIETQSKNEIQTIEEGDDDDWEDVTDVSFEEQDDQDKFSLGEKEKMTQYIKGEELFFGLLIHNEHIKADLRFHDFQQNEPN